MPTQSDGVATVGYVVSTWPRLSQTFVLSEILALERLGLPLRIFSTKDPGEEPVHADVARVRAPVTYLSLGRWRAILWGNVRLACSLPEHYFATLLGALRYHRWGVLRRFLQAGYLAHLLRREPVAHLHAHFATAPALVAMFAHELIGIRYTFTAHARDIYVDTRPELLHAEIENAAAVITVSQYNRTRLHRMSAMANGKVYCIYNGLDLGQFRPHGSHVTVGQTPVILSVGRLVEKKGLGDLIEAAHILRARGRSFRVEIVGAGPLRPKLEAQVERLGLQDEVKLLGAQPQEAVRQAYERATIFALPCVITTEGDRDGIPTVLLEAMASGLPVVSTPVSGIPELIDPERDGLLVASRSPRKLADALDRLLSDPQLRESLARAAREKIETRFNIERSSRELAAVFGLATAQRGENPSGGSQ